KGDVAGMGDAREYVGIAKKQRGPRTTHVSPQRGHGKPTTTLAWYSRWLRNDNSPLRRWARWRRGITLASRNRSDARADRLNRHLGRRHRDAQLHLHR